MSQASTLLVSQRADRPRYRKGALARLIGSEIGMVFRRKRNIALLIALAAAPIAIGIAVKVSTPDHAGDGPDFVAQISNNGLFLVFSTLTVAVPLLIPLLIGVVAGDSVSGEAGTGTLRYLLVIPVTRSRLLIAKAAAVSAYVVAAISAVTLVGLISGGALFGLHDMTLLSGDTISLAAGLGRALYIACYVVLTLSGFVAIGLFISTLTEVPIAAMAATLAIAIVASVLDAIPQLGNLRHLLFVDHWTSFTAFLSQTIDWHSLDHYLLLQLAYVAIFGSATWARFVTADITS